MIGTIAKLLGLDSLLVYAIIAVLAGGGIWAWSAHRYNAGYAAGEMHERQAWEVAQKKARAEAEAERMQKQDELDRLETAYLNAQHRADEAEASLAEASEKSKTKDVIGLPREVGRELNKIGRW